MSVDQGHCKWSCTFPKTRLPETWFMMHDALSARQKLNRKELKDIKGFGAFHACALASSEVMAEEAK